MRRFANVCLVFATALTGEVVAAPAALAQDVEVTSTSKVELSGILGDAFRLFGGGGETTEKTYIKGARMRTDTEDVSTIVDLENGRFITIDHKQKTYTLVTLDHMAEAMEQVKADVSAELAQARAEAPPGERGDVQLRYDVQLDRTSDRARIGGLDAQRHFMTIATNATVTPEGGEAEAAGTMVLLIETWNAKDTPAQRALEQFATGVPASTQLRNQAAMEQMSAAFPGGSSLAEAMKKAGDEMSKIEGYDMRSTTYFVLVPPGLELDREAVLSGGQSGGARKGGIRGILSRAAGIQRQDEPPPDEPRQVSIAKMTTEVKEMKTRTLEGSLFEPPLGYREAQLRIER